MAPLQLGLALIEPSYHKASSQGGRPPIPLGVMRWIHLLQQWFTLSDPVMEERLIGTPCLGRFAGIGTMEGRIPDETKGTSEKPA